MAKASDSYSIRYEGFYDLADELEHIGATVESYNKEVSDALKLVQEYHAVYHQLKKSVMYNLSWGAQHCAITHTRLSNHLPRVMRSIANTCEEHEKAARRHCHWFGSTVNSQLGGFSSNGMADEYYAAAAAAAAKAEADRIKAEEEEKARQEAEAQAKAEAEAKEKRAQELLGKLSPTAAQEYVDRITEAEFQELMEIYKDDPEMLAKIKQDYEAWKKSRSQTSTLTDGLSSGSSDYGATGYTSDYSSGYGSDYSSGYSSDGLYDYSSDGDWASSDWASDLLEEGVDTSDYWDADSAVDDILGSTLEDAISTGAEAAADAADIAEPGMFDEFGGQLASVVQSYGLQAALAIGGGVALYATREQTIEAAAHVAEFVSTKCKPAVNDVMEQVKGMAKKTRVNLTKAASNVKAAVRGKKAGDLIE